MPHLIFSQHGKTLLQVPLTKQNTQVGRSQACDVVLSEPTISRLQFSVYQLEGSYFVKNLGKAKLKLNGKIVEASSISENDFLELEAWRIALGNSDSSSLENQEDTYVSHAISGTTQALHLSRVGEELHYETLQLKVQSPQGSVKFYPIQQGTNTLGKSPACDIKIEDSYVSDTHAKLICQDSKVLIYDLQSTNGTYVNGLKAREVELDENSVVKIGQSEITLELKSHSQKIKGLSANSFGPFVGKSKAMRELYALIQQVASTHAPICIFGETGTGKELVAKSLHDLSGRKEKAWVVLNCGAIAKELIQSELFGHEKGAFTGAQQQHKGVFEQAQGSTLFLDEIAELPLDLQTNLLRVLETGKIRRVGSVQEIPVDVRIVCATHQDLARLVSEKKFREDLFFRLHVLPLYLAPLRERKEDIPLLAEHFLKIFLPEGRTLIWSAETLDFLMNQDWPGNVREFKNAIQRAVILAKKAVLEPSDFGFLSSRGAACCAQNEGAPRGTPTNLQDIEKQVILQELERQKDNRLATAKALGISKSTLYEKFKLYGIK